MRFCENCGSYMEKTTKGFLCSQCGERVNTQIIEIQDNEKPDPAVFIIDHQDT